MPSCLCAPVLGDIGGRERIREAPGRQLIHDADLRAGRCLRTGRHCRLERLRLLGWWDGLAPGKCTTACG